MLALVLQVGEYGGRLPGTEVAHVVLQVEQGLMPSLGLIHLLSFRIDREGDLFMAFGSLFIAFGDERFAIGLVLLDCTLFLVAVLL
jgi:hypothetical protein